MIHTIFNKRSNVYLCLLMATLLLLAACGGGEEDSPQSSTSANENTAAEQEPVAEEPTAETEAVAVAEETETRETETSTSNVPQEGTITLEKTSFDPDERIKIQVALVGEAGNAWVGIIPSSVPHGSEEENDQFDISYQYVSNVNDEGVVYLNAPLEAGQYDVRLFNTDDGSDGIELDYVSFGVGGVEPSDGTTTNETDETGEKSTDVAAETESETAVADSSNNDSCLIGTWRFTNFDAYFVASVEQAMEGEDLGGLELDVSSQSSGDLLVTFDGSTMTMSENNFFVTATMMGISVPTEIDASGSASYTADGNTLEGFVDNVNVQESTGFGINLSNLAGETITYTCSGDTMSWAGPYAIPLELTRVN